MSFSTHMVVTRADLAKGTGLSVSLQKMRSAQATLLFTMRPEVASQLGWSDKDRIEVGLGEDEHHGLVRLRKSDAGTAVLQYRVTGDDKRGGPYFRLSLGTVPLFVNRSEAKRWVIFDVVEDGWVEVVLPSWADETGPRNRTDRPRLSAGVAPVAALPAPEKPSGKELTSRMMGDPPPGRSALAQRKGAPLEMTRGAARRQAAEREAPEHEVAEAADWNRKAESENRLALISTAFALTVNEAHLVEALLDGKLKTREALHLAAYGNDPNGGPEIKIIDVFVTKIRKKLKTRMIEIETVWGQGYRMTPDNVARVMVLVDRAEAGE